MDPAPEPDEERRETMRLAAHMVAAEVGAAVPDAGELARARAEVEAARKAQADAEAKVDARDRAARALEQGVAVALERVSGLEQAVARAEERAKEHEAARHRAEGAAEASRAEAAARKREVDAARQDVVAREQEAAKLRAELQDRAREVERLRAELAERTAAVARVEAEKAAIGREVVRLEQELRAKEAAAAKGAAPEAAEPVDESVVLRALGKATFDGAGAVLEVIGGAAIGLVVSVPKDTLVTLGSSEAASYDLADARLAKKHCALKLTGRVLKIADLKSPGGTTVNGTRVDDLTPIEEGDLVAIGGLTLRVRQVGPREKKGSA